MSNKDYKVTYSMVMTINASGPDEVNRLIGQWVNLHSDIDEDNLDGMFWDNVDWTNPEEVTNV